PDCSRGNVRDQRAIICRGRKIHWGEKRKNYIYACVSTNDFYHYRLYYDEYWWCNYLCCQFEFPWFRGSAILTRVGSNVECIKRLYRARIPSHFLPGLRCVFNSVGIKLVW